MNDLLSRFMPILRWAPAYQARDLPGDLMAGLITAIMLVPQSMAYAMVAGLPPQIGLYSAVAPLILYGIFGSSRALAVGPVAIASLMTGTMLAGFAPAGSPEYVGAAIILALMNGVMLLVLGLVRGGFLVNFLSHPVISGFTTAAAILIALSQIGVILGLKVPKGTAIELLTNLGKALPGTNVTAMVLGVAAALILLAMRGPLTRALQKTALSDPLVQLLTKSGPLVVVALGTWVVGAMQLHTAGSVAIVGEIPRGLPGIALPAFDRELWLELLPVAALISFVGYLESVSVAKALAARRRERIDANQELFGLGAANIGSALTGGYSVAGGFARSMVNFTAGANTPLASILTAVLVAVAVMFLTPALYFLPRAVLAAIILIAILSLVDLQSLVRTWRYSKVDGGAQLVTLVVVLTVGVEAGILAGVGLSLILHLARTSRPHFAIVGQMGETEHYRNIHRHKVRTEPEILLVRVDESLYFANAGALEDHIQHYISEGPEITDVVLICSAVNVIDASALEALERLIVNLRSSGVTLHLAEVKGPVMDRLQRTHFLKDLEPGHVFLSTHDAATTLREKISTRGFDPSI